MRPGGMLLAWVLMAMSTPGASVELRWDVEKVAQREYKAAMEVDVTGELGGIGSANRKISREALSGIVQDMKRLSFPEAYYHYRTRFESIRNGDALRVRLVGVPVALEGEPSNRKELELSHRTSALTNAIMLQGDIDSSGDGTELTFYRNTKERNVLTQLFYLPKGEVAPGETWVLPVKLGEFGPGIFVEDSARQNQVTLAALRDTPQGRMAELHYLVEEDVNGFMERNINNADARATFGMKVTLFGYGEFLVERGYWLRQVLVISYTGKGAAKVNGMHLFALELLD